MNKNILPDGRSKFSMIPAEVTADERLTHADVRVYAALDRRAGDHRFAWMLRSTLEEEARVSPRGSRDCVKRLTAAGWLLSIQRHRRSSVFVLRNPARRPIDLTAVHERVLAAGIAACWRQMLPFLAANDVAHKKTPERDHREGDHGSTSTPSAPKAATPKPKGLKVKVKGGSEGGNPNIDLARTLAARLVEEYGYLGLSENKVSWLIKCALDYSPLSADVIEDLFHERGPKGAFDVLRRYDQSPELAGKGAA